MIKWLIKFNRNYLIVFAIIIILIIAAILILLYSLGDPNLKGTDIYLNIGTELIGIAFSLFIISLIFGYIERRRWKPLEERIVADIQSYIVGFYVTSMRYVNFPDIDTNNIKDNEEKIYFALQRRIERLPNEFKTQITRFDFQTIKKLEKDLTILSDSANKFRDELKSLPIPDLREVFEKLCKQLNNLVNRLNQFTVIKELPELAMPEKLDALAEQIKDSTLFEYESILKTLREIQNFITKEYGSLTYYQKELEK